MAAVVILASVALMLRLSQDILPMDMVFVLLLMVMDSVLLFLVLLVIPVLLPPLLPGLLRELASVVLMLNQVTLPMVSVLMLMVLVSAFLTTELFTVSASSTLLDTPIKVLSVASVVLMLMLMLTTDMDTPMDMLAMDTMAMVDTAMAVDTTGVNQTKLFLYHHLEI